MGELLRLINILQSDSQNVYFLTHLDRVGFKKNLLFGHIFLQSDVQNIYCLSRFRTVGFTNYRLFEHIFLSSESQNIYYLDIFLQFLRIEFSEDRHFQKLLSAQIPTIRFVICEFYIGWIF